MPLDILPATPAPGGAAPGASTSQAPAAPGPAGPPGLVAVFGLLLAQIATAPDSPAPVGAAKSAIGTDTTATPAPKESKSPATSDNDKSKGDTKNKQSVTDALWTTPAPILPAPTLPPPILLKPIMRPAVTQTALPLSDKTTLGKVMDTVPPTGSELLSQPQGTAAQGQIAAQGQTNAAGPTGAAETQAATPDTPGPAANVPVLGAPPTLALAAQTSQEVILAAGPVPIGPTVAGPPAPSKPTPAAVLPTLDISQTARTLTSAPTPAAPTPAAPTPAAPTPAAPTPAAPTPAAPTPAAPSAAALPLAGPNVAVPAILQNGVPPSDNPTGKIAEAPALPQAAVPADATQAKSATEKAAGTKADAASGAAPTTRADQPALTLLNAPVTPATVPNTAPMPEPDRTRMVHQVADGVQTLAAQAGGGGQRQVTLQLHPQDWGRLHVSVTMTPTTGADGKVTTQVVAHVVAENTTVKAALDAHQADLRRTLQSAGLHLDTLTVSVQAPSGGAQAGLGNNDRQPGSNDGWAGAQSQTGGTGAQGGTPFNGNGGQQSAFAGFAQGDSPRRQPPTPYAANSQTTDTGAEDRSVAATARSGRSGRVDIQA